MCIRFLLYRFKQRIASSLVCALLASQRNLIPNIARVYPEHTLPGTLISLSSLEKFGSSGVSEKFGDPVSGRVFK